MRTPHSRLGIASFALSVLAWLSTLALFGAAGLLSSRGERSGSPTYVALGLCFFGLLGAELSALALGVASIYQRDRNRTFGVLGLVLATFLILITVALLIVGAAHKRHPAAR